MLQTLKKAFGSQAQAPIPSKEITIVKADGKHETFNPEKLRFSLLNSGATPEATEEVLSHLIPSLHSGMSTGDIYRHAFGILSKINKPVARSYSLRRSVMDLGPSGFPFEDFVAEVLRAKGMECVTRQTVLGGCVAHEVDVVAYDENRLIMIEAKFHNELGTKSDLKVVLYIKARFDDLRDNVFSYGSKDRKITDAWLVTNTKFSSTAIQYGVCKGMTLIGWNYPAKGNLQAMIEEEGLHPVTCLTSISGEEKKKLLEAGVVLCSNIKKNPGVLRQLLGGNFDSTAVLTEINEL
jgi:hypothetical protein